MAQVEEHTDDIGAVIDMVGNYLAASHEHTWNILTDMQGTDLARLHYIEDGILHIANTTPYGDTTATYEDAMYKMACLVRPSPSNPIFMKYVEQGRKIAKGEMNSHRRMNFFGGSTGSM